MTTRAKLEHLYAQLDAITLEEYLEKRQVDRLLERLGVTTRPTPRPRFRSRSKAPT
jgi:hypothetical protein